MFQGHEGAFYFVKGLLATIATVMLIYHMSATWPKVKTWDHRLRYFSLLWFAALITFASVQQSHDLTSVNLRNVLAALGCVLLIATAWASIQADRRRDSNDDDS